MILISSVLLSLAFVPDTAEADTGTLENWPVFRAGPASDFFQPCIALDNDGGVHLAYLYHDPLMADWNYDLNYLRYSVLSNGTWEHINLGDEAAITSLDMALDGAGYAHIVCTQRQNATCDVVYWTNAGGEWASEVAMHLETDYVHPVNMALDQGGKVHIVMSWSYPSDRTNFTHYYLNNAQGDWVSEPLYTFPGYYNLLNAVPEILVDNLDKVHIVYQSVSDLTFGDWTTGNYTLNVLTYVDGERTANITLPIDGYCGRFSLQVDAAGKEHILYNQLVPGGPYFEGPIVLAVRAVSTWTEWVAGYGDERCQLIIDKQGTTHIIFNHEQGMTMMDDGTGLWSQRDLILPYGVYVNSDDFRAGVGNGTVLVFYDDMADEVIISRPSANPQLYPKLTSLEQVKYTVRIEWNATDPMDGPEIENYVIYRYYPSASFLTEADQTGLVDDMTSEHDTNGPPTHYRISVITAAGEEYIGGTGSIWLDPSEAYEGDWWVALFSFTGIVVVLVILLLGLALVFVLMRREKLT